MMGKELERSKISLGKLFMRIKIHVLRLITKESSQFSSLSRKKTQNNNSSNINQYYIFTINLT